MVKKEHGTLYSLSALRRTALHTQRLDLPNGCEPPPTPDALVDLVAALNYVQIDTLQVVNRSHHVAVWSRLGAYNIEDLHRLLYTPGERRLYEGWGHAASIIPLEHYRYHRWRISDGTRAWLEKEENRRLAADTLERIRSEGGLRAADFDYDGPKRGAWYDWKPSKMALEALFATGDLMVADRVGFQRVYDVRERVLPGWVDAAPLSADEGRRFCLEQAALTLGVFEPRSLSWYAHMFATPAQPILKALIDEGVLANIQGQALSGTQTWMVHRANLPLLERAADGELAAQRTTFLSPFDSFFWAGQRDEKLWGFRQVLECYKPPAQRIYGYLTFPILHGERLVGRFDPKLERKSGLLQLNALYLQPGVAPDDVLVAAVGAAMRSFMAWHGARELSIVRSDPPAFGAALLKAI